MNQALQHIYDRFIATLPPEELVPARLMVNLEEAHWFFEDRLLQKFGLQSVPFESFLSLLRKQYPLLAPGFTVKQLLDKHHSYSVEIPRRGAILLNSAMDKVILVSNFSGKVFGFPRGKMNQQESDVACAIREVEEEVGIDITNLINPEQFLTYQDGPTNTRLYIITGISEDAQLMTNTRCEIGSIQWVKLDDIPSKKNKNVSPYRNYMFRNVHQFLSDLRKWIQSRREMEEQERIPKADPHSFLEIRNFRFNRRRLNYVMDSWIFN